MLYFSIAKEASCFSGSTCTLQKGPKYRGRCSSEELCWKGEGTVREEMCTRSYRRWMNGQIQIQRPLQDLTLQASHHCLFWNQKKWAWEIISIILVRLIPLCCNRWNTNHLFLYIWQNTFSFYCLGQTSPIFQADCAFGSNAPKWLCCRRTAEHWHGEIYSTEPQVRMLRFPADWFVLSIAAI